MPKPPRQKEVSLADLRREIDRIDAAMHALLIERGEIIDTLIAVKKTEETGSAFRPAREADMMRRLVERHHGNLPLDTAESIWRVIISTFTYVQAPFSVHADLSAGDALMRDSARFHFGFTVPFVPHMGAASVVEAVSESKGDLGLVPAFAIAGAGPWWAALEFDAAPKIIARLPFVERADHPAGMPVFRCLARRRRRHGDRDRGLEHAGVRLERRVDRHSSPSLPTSSRCPTAPSTARRCWFRSRAAASTRSRRPWSGWRLDPVRGPRRQSRDPLYGARQDKALPASREGIDEVGASEMSAMRPQPRPGVLDIEAYVPGKSSAPGVAKVFKLSSNETPLGPSPKAIAAYKAAADHLEDYPDGSASDLREAIGRVFGLDPERIVCGSGSDDLLHLLANAYLVDGDEAIYTTHGFLIYPIVTLGTGAKPIVAPEKNYTADVDAILAAVTERTQDRLPRQSEQSDRHLPAVRRGEAAASRPAAAMCCWCSTPPMPNTSGATITKPASNWWRRRKTSS